MLPRSRNIRLIWKINACAVAHYHVRRETNSRRKCSSTHGQITSIAHADVTQGQKEMRLVVHIANSMDAELYYTAPTDALFEEVRTAAMDLWDQYPDKRYVQDKHNRIKDIGNVSDNFMYIVAMFDIQNQRILASMISKECREAINDRMKDGGQPDWANPFL